MKNLMKVLLVLFAISMVVFMVSCEQPTGGGSGNGGNTTNPSGDTVEIRAIKFVSATMSDAEIKTMAEEQDGLLWSENGLMPGTWNGTTYTLTTPMDVELPPSSALGFSYDSSTKIMTVDLDEVDLDGNPVNPPPFVALVIVEGVIFVGTDVEYLTETEAKEGIATVLGSVTPAGTWDDADKTYTFTTSLSLPETMVDDSASGMSYDSGTRMVTVDIATFGGGVTPPSDNVNVAGIIFVGTNVASLTQAEAVQGIADMLGSAPAGTWVDADKTYTFTTSIQLPSSLVNDSSMGLSYDSTTSMVTVDIDAFGSGTPPPGTVEIRAIKFVSSTMTEAEIKARAEQSGPLWDDNGLMPGTWVGTTYTFNNPIRSALTGLPNGFSYDSSSTTMIIDLDVLYGGVTPPSDNVIVEGVIFVGTDVEYLTETEAKEGIATVLGSVTPAGTWDDADKTYTFTALLSLPETMVNDSASGMSYDSGTRMVTVDIDAFGSGTPPGPGGDTKLITAITFTFAGMTEAEIRNMAESTFLKEQDGSVVPGSWTGTTYTLTTPVNEVIPPLFGVSYDAATTTMTVDLETL